MSKQRTSGRAGGHPARSLHRSRSRIASVAALGLLAGALAACGSSGGGEGTDSGPIVIPHLNSITGAMSAYQASTAIPADMAVAAINADGGIDGRDLEINKIDSQTVTTTAVQNFRTEATDAVAVVGPESSGELSAVAPLAKAAGVPIVAGLPTVVQLAADNQPWLYLSQPNIVETQTFGTERWLEASPGIATVTVLTNDQDAASQAQGEAVEDALEEEGVEISTLGFQTDQTSFTSLVGRALASDGVVIATGPAQGAAIAEELDRQGYEGSVFAISNVLGPTFTETAGASADGFFGVLGSYVDENTSPEAKEFIEAYEAKAGTGFTVVAMYEYQAWMLLAEALRAADLSGSLEEQRTSVQKALRSVSITGLAGEEIGFNDKGYIERPSAFLKVRADGTFELIK